MIFIIIKIIKLIKGDRQLIIKIVSNKLNLKLYNRLGKEIKDFKNL